MPLGCSPRPTSTDDSGSASLSPSFGSSTVSACSLSRVHDDTRADLPDVFFRQKCDTFSRSNQAVFELSQRFSQPHVHEPGLSEAAKLEKNKLIFLELTQGKPSFWYSVRQHANCSVCLWGNSTDLSLLIDMTEDDIKKLQSTGGEHLAATEKNILGNDLHKLADYVMTIKNGRIDFVLDNAGEFTALLSHPD